MPPPGVPRKTRVLFMVVLWVFENEQRKQMRCRFLQTDRQTKTTFQQIPQISKMEMNICQFNPLVMRSDKRVIQPYTKKWAGHFTGENNDRLCDCWNCLTSQESQFSCTSCFSGLLRGLNKTIHVIGLVPSTFERLSKNRVPFNSPVRRTSKLCLFDRTVSVWFPSRVVV